MTKVLYDYEKQTNKERMTKIYEETAIIKSKEHDLAELEESTDYEAIASLHNEIDTVGCMGNH
jgi:hypothetical protein